MPTKVPGLLFFFIEENHRWQLHARLMKYFYIDEFESGTFDPFDIDHLVFGHTNDICDFEWPVIINDETEVDCILMDLIQKYASEKPKSIVNIDAIVYASEKYTQLLHFRK